MHSPFLIQHTIININKNTYILAHLSLTLLLFPYDWSPVLAWLHLWRRMGGIFSLCLFTAKTKLQKLYAFQYHKLERKPLKQHCTIKTQYKKSCIYIRSIKELTTIIILIDSEMAMISDFVVKTKLIRLLAMWSHHLGENLRSFVFAYIIIQKLWNLPGLMNPDPPTS